MTVMLNTCRYGGRATASICAVLVRSVLYKYCTRVPVLVLEYCSTYEYLYSELSTVPVRVQVQDCTSTSNVQVPVLVYNTYSVRVQSVRVQVYKLYVQVLHAYLYILYLYCGLYSHVLYSSCCGSTSTRTVLVLIQVIFPVLLYWVLSTVLVQHTVLAYLQVYCSRRYEYKYLFSSLSTPYWCTL